MGMLNAICTHHTVSADALLFCVLQISVGFVFILLLSNHVYVQSKDSKIYTFFTQCDSTTLVCIGVFFLYFAYDFGVFHPFVYSHRANYTIHCSADLYQCVLIYSVFRYGK